MSAGILKVDRWNPDAGVMLRAGSILRGGGLVAFPTETVYGLGANGLSPEAIRKIFLTASGLSPFAPRP